MFVVSSVPLIFFVIGGVVCVSFHFIYLCPNQANMLPRCLPGMCSRRVADGAQRATSRLPTPSAVNYVHMSLARIDVLTHLCPVHACTFLLETPKMLSYSFTYYSSGYV